MLSEFLMKIDIKDCELDVRFQKGVNEYFNFQKLRDFEDLSKKHKTHKEYSDGPIDLTNCF